VAGPFHHRPVLLAESLAHLALRPSSWVADGTVGGGGHAAAILERTSPDGRLIGLDVDAEALVAARHRLARYGPRVRLRQASFREWRRVAAELGLPRIDAMLLDLGVSSHQMDCAARGFRFAAETAAETPLDMRMDRRLAATAADLLRDASESELERIFRHYGELPGARRLTRAIVEARRHASLRTSTDLLRVLRESGAGRGRRHHPATLAFQALRIAVNDELGALREGLEAALQTLAPGGRLVVISYHSLEDRIVKQWFVSEARGCRCPPRQPVCTCGRSARLRILTRRPERPSVVEQRENPRSRSARLRCAERLAEAC
jgi:16S rRNA (cytosine1402-N4)-methyltransferase